MDNTACLTLTRVKTGLRKRANTRAAETHAEITFAARVILLQLASYYLLERVCNFVALLKPGFTSRHRHRRDYEIEHKPSTENGGAREERLGREETETRLVLLSSCISSFCHRRNPHRDNKNEN